MVKELTLGVRAASASETTSELIPIGPGETIELDAKRFAQIVVAHRASSRSRWADRPPRRPRAAAPASTATPMGAPSR